MPEQTRRSISISNASIAGASLDICRAYTGSDLKLTFLESVVPDDWGRNLVWRYRVESAPAGFPGTVIVKTSKIGGGHIFDEWASLRFLREFEALTHYTQHADFTTPFPRIARALTQLHRKLQAQWTREERSILPFPAFRQVSRPNHPEQIGVHP